MMTIIGEREILPLSRRHFLWQAGGGLGAIALACMLNDESKAEGRSAGSPYAPKPTHFPGKARRVIHIFACGGVSHVDTFDHKPELEKRHGQELTGKGKIDTFFGKPGRLAKSPFKFRRYGNCGHAVSDLLPNLGTCVDDMTF